jgi:hypothetical protein
MKLGAVVVAVDSQLWTLECDDIVLVLWLDDIVP